MTMREFVVALRDAARDAALEHSRPVLAVDFEPSLNGGFHIQLTFRFRAA